ncbi:MAG: hypothetical protein RIT43_2188 [Bacteroidota bacterium]|jgi:hypothetical protein
MIQKVLVILCVLAALFFLFKRALKKYRTRKEGCDGCAFHESAKVEK